MWKRIVPLVFVVGAIGALWWTTRTDDAGKPDVALDTEREVIPERAGRLAGTGLLADANTDSLQGGLRVAGRVVDEQGKGAAGVPVVVVDNGNLNRNSRTLTRQHRVVDETTSRVDGGFTLHMPRGKTTLWLEARPLPPQIGDRVHLAGGAARAHTLRVTHGSRLHGQVQWPNGSGAAAVLTSLRSDRLPMSISTDRNGSFVMAAPPAGVFSVQVTVPGRISFTARTMVPRADVWHISIPHGEGAAFGTVTDSNRSAVKGATISAYWAHKGQHVSTVATTNTSGMYRMEGVPDDAALTTLLGTADGYLDVRLTVSGRSLEEPIDLVMRPAARLRGTATSANGTAAVGMELLGLQMGARFSATVGAKGTFEMTGLNPVDPVIVVGNSKGWYLPLQKAQPPMSSRSGDTQVALSAPPKATVVALVVERNQSLRVRAETRDGVAVPDVLVTARAQFGYRAMLMPQQASTGSDGTVLIEVYPKSTWILEGRHATLVNAPKQVATINEDTEDPVILRMVPVASIAGVVIDTEGVPVADAHVVWKSARVRSAQDGTFLLGGLQAGSATLRVMTTGRTGGQRLTIEQGQPYAGLVIELPAITKMSGVVVDAAGEPVTLTQLYAVESKGFMAVGNTVTDDGGEFEFDLPNDKPVRIRVAGKDAGEYEPGPDVRIRLGDETAEQISIRVQDEAGMPIPLVTVDMLTHAPGSGTMHRAHKASGGTHTLQVPAEGRTVRLTFTEPQDKDGQPMALLSATVVINANSEHEITVVLPAGRTISGRVETEDGAPVAGAVVTYRNDNDVRRATSANDGTFALNGVPEGQLTLRVKGASINAKPTVVAEDESDVVIRVTLSGTVIAVVMTQDQQPIAGAKVTIYAGQWFRHGTTDEKGRAEIEGVAIGEKGHIEVEPGHKAEKFPTYSQSYDSVPQSITVRVGQSAWAEGTAYLSDGSVAAKTVLVLLSVDGRTTYSLAQTDADGAFRIGPVKPGTYRIRLQGKPNLETLVTLPNHSIRLTQPRGAKLAGRLISDHDSGWSVTWITPAGGATAKVDADGRFVFQDPVADRPGYLLAHRAGQAVVSTEMQPTESVVLKASAPLVVAGRTEPATTKRSFLLLRGPKKDRVVVYFHTTSDGHFSVRSELTTGWSLGVVGQKTVFPFATGTEDFVLRWK